MEGRKMKIIDAANILGLSGDITQEDVKKAFHAQAKKYHPDINPAGTEMMKVINAAFEALKDYTGTIKEEDSNSDYPAALNDALTAIITLVGLNIEICGAWVWVTGNTFKHKDALKENGFKYASKKKSWHFRPENWKSSSRGQSTMEDIRFKYGSSSPSMRYRKSLTCSGV